MLLGLVILSLELSFQNYVAYTTKSFFFLFNETLYIIINIVFVLVFLQFRADYGSQWSGAYYGGHMYDGYGYALPPPHGMYATAATAYGTYPVAGNHQQQVS